MSRNAPINKLQKEMLVEYMEKNTQLQSGAFNQNFTFKKAHMLWEEITEILNSIAGGANKDWKQWRKVKMA